MPIEFGGQQFKEAFSEFKAQVLPSKRKNDPYVIDPSTLSTDAPAHKIRKLNLPSPPKLSVSFSIKELSIKLPDKTIQNLVTFVKKLFNEIIKGQPKTVAHMRSSVIIPQPKVSSFSLESFEQNVCHPLTDKPNHEGLRTLASQTAQVILEADSKGVYDWQLHKEIMSKAMAAGLSAAAVLGDKQFSLPDRVGNTLKQHSTQGQETACRFERYERQLNFLPTLEKFGALSRQISQNSAEPSGEKMKALESQKALLQEVLQDISKLTDPTEKQQAIEAIAKMCAFGNAFSEDLGDSLQTASTTREAGLARHALLTSIDSNVTERIASRLLQLLVSDSDQIQSNSIICRASSVPADLCQVGEQIRVDEKIFTITAKNENSLELRSADGEKKIVDVSNDTKVVRVSVQKYLRQHLPEDQLKVLSKVKQQLAEVEKRASIDLVDQVHSAQVDVEEQIDTAKYALMSAFVSSGALHHEAIAPIVGSNTATLSALFTGVLALEPNFSENQLRTLTIDGKEFTVLITKGPGDEPDIWLKGKRLGEGAAGEIHEWVSVRTGSSYAMKKATAMAEGSDDAKNEKQNLEALNVSGRQIGVQGTAKELSLGTLQGLEKVLVMEVKEYGDAGKYVDICHFAINWLGITNEEELRNPASINEKMQAKLLLLEKQIQQAETAQEKRQVVAEFRAVLEVLNQKVFRGQFTELSAIFREMQNKL